MNLSSYLQMPPAPSVSQTPSTALPTGAPAGVRPEPGASLGLDFAKIMARQFQRMPQTQRQAFAAPAPASDEVTTRANAQAKAQDQDTRATDRQSQESTNTDDLAHRQADDVRAQEASSKAEDKNKKQTAQAREAADAELTSDSATTTQATQWVAVQPTPGTQEVKPQALQANPYLKDVALPSSDATTTPFRTVELSPHMRIITDPRKAPSAESLTAFAKSMGLDEAAIQKLMGDNGPTEAATMPLSTGAAPIDIETGLSNTAPSALLTDKLAASLADANMAKISAQPTGFGLPTAPMASANAASHTLGAALQGLTPADLASIQQIQITVAPAAIASVAPSVGSATTPSTASVLSLMGAGLSEQDINTLAASFGSGAAGGESSLDQQSSGGNSTGDGAHAFGQALPRQVVTSSAAGPSSAQATSQTHMSEVYDQLSDKMATEMAARMHKQLSDGEWKMKFGLRPANLGGVEIQLEMKDGKLDAVIHADNPLTRDLLQNSSQRLRDALENFGIHAGQFHIGQDSRGTQQNPSRGSAKQSQVGENSPSQVKSSNSVTSAEAVSTKANASLLDLYA